MKSVKDCLNMAETSIANPRSKRGKIRVKNQSLHEDSAHACAESHDPELMPPKDLMGYARQGFDDKDVAVMHYSVDTTIPSIHSLFSIQF